jgi:hypothetical protein
MRRIAALLMPCLLVGCSSAIEIPDFPQPSTRASGQGIAQAQAPSDVAYQPPGPSLRRLTVAQYKNSLRELFGEAVRAPTDLEADTVLHGFASIGSAQIALSARATELFEAAALEVGQQALSNVATRAGFVGCSPTGAKDDVCAREFLRRFGRKAWRRPLTDVELQRYAAIADDASAELMDGWAGLQYAVAGILQSPLFLYRVELGQDDPANLALRPFDGFELATRLSFFVWNSTPDDVLLDAAERGELATTSGLAAQAERLLQSPRARAALQDFWQEMLHLDELGQLPQLPSAYPLMSEKLGASMRAETLQVLDDLVFARAGDYRELFTTQSTFVDAELARLYGLAPVAADELVAATFPADSRRAGLLGHASFLALGAHATTTSPTRRGRFVREVLLCQAVPAPPPNVSTELPADPASGEQRTMRQKLEFHRSQQACASCHAMMDPIGLALEHFDGIGAYRETDRNLPIDASGELDAVAFQDAVGLGQALSAHRELGPCLSRSFFRYATGRLEAPTEQPLVADVAGRFAADAFRVRSLLLAVIQSDAFRFAGKLD